MRHAEPTDGIHEELNADRHAGDAARRRRPARLRFRQGHDRRRPSRWSEYNEAFGGAGLTTLIHRLAPTLVGKDPRAHEAHVALMQALRRTAAGGVVQQAIGAIENALIDVKARALGIPVYELLGGPVRERIRLYWSHCGTYRVSWWRELQLPPCGHSTTWCGSGARSCSAATRRSRPTSFSSATSRACTRRG